MSNYKNTVQVRPGDIVLMNTNTIPGVVIKLGTVSTITHVAIAISYDQLLESTPDKDNQDLRKIDLSTALKDARSAIVYKREVPLTEAEIEKIKSMYYRLEQNPKKRRYHVGIAGAAGIPAIINVSNVTVIIGTASYHAIYGGAIGYLIFMVPVAVWGLRVVRQVARFLATRYPNNWLTKEIEGSYCSGFVALSEKEIGSEIWKYIDRKPYDPRPKDIAYACKKNKMSWVAYNFKDTPTTWIIIKRKLKSFFRNKK